MDDNKKQENKDSENVNEESNIAPNTDDPLKDFEDWDEGAAEDTVTTGDIASDFDDVEFDLDDFNKGDDGIAVDDDFSDFEQQISMEQEEMAGVKSKKGGSLIGKLLGTTIFVGLIAGIGYGYVTYKDDIGKLLSGPQALMESASQELPNISFPDVKEIGAEFNNDNTQTDLNQQLPQPTPMVVDDANPVDEPAPLLSDVIENSVDEVFDVDETASVAPIFSGNDVDALPNPTPVEIVDSVEDVFTDGVDAVESVAEDIVEAPQEIFEDVTEDLGVPFGDEPTTANVDEANEIPPAELPSSEEVIVENTSSQNFNEVIVFDEAPANASEAEENVLFETEIEEDEPEVIETFEEEREAVREVSVVRSKPVAVKKAYVDPYAAERNTTVYSLIENQELQLAKKAFRDERYNDALRIYEGLKNKNPNNYDILMGYALTLDYMGRRDDAISAYRDVLSLSPNDNLSKQNIEQLKNSSERQSTARVNTRQETEYQLTPSSQSGSATQAINLAKQGSYDQALSIMNSVIRSEPNNAQNHYNLAVIYDLKGDRLYAIRTYEKALELDVLYNSNSSIPRGQIYDRLSYLRREL